MASGLDWPPFWAWLLAMFVASFGVFLVSVGTSGDEQD
jgi:hypothetical protein